MITREPHRHLTATITGLPAGDYELRARSVDVNGHAQPEPRPVQKSGKNAIGCRRVSFRA